LEVETGLKEVGLPLTNWDFLGGEHNQFKFNFLPLPAPQAPGQAAGQDWLQVADSYTMAKWLIRHIALEQGWTYNFLPAEASQLSI
jgi:hypothetical protein